MPLKPYDTFYIAESVRDAAVSTLITVLLVAIYTSFGLPFILVSVLAGLVAAHSVREVRHREDFYLSGIRVVAAYGAAIFVAAGML